MLGVSISKFLLRLRLPPRVIGRTAKNKTSLNFNLPPPDTANAANRAQTTYIGIMGLFLSFLSFKMAEISR